MLTITTDRESAAYVKRQLKDGPRPGPIITEMRAAFLLNRFSRASPVMFATQEVTRLLKLRPQEIVGNSFYHLVQESCLQNIVFAIERAKAYNEVVYLRFWYQNPYYERRSDLPFHIWGGKDGSRIQSEPPELLLLYSHPEYHANPSQAGLRTE